jgi:YHS domain-containing protein
MKTSTTLCLLALLVSIVPGAIGEEASDAGEHQLTPSQMLMAVQQICPVSGQKLGSHGEPLAVKIGDEHLFLCCRGCTSGKVNREHWATIHANFAKAQGICPVMKHELPQNAKWTIVQGRIIYVCCPPCIKKIEAQPETYLKTVDSLYLASLKQQQTD